MHIFYHIFASFNRPALCFCAPALLRNYAFMFLLFFNTLRFFMQFFDTNIVSSFPAKGPPPVGAEGPSSRKKCENQFVFKVCFSKENMLINYFCSVIHFSIIFLLKLEIRGLGGSFFWYADGSMLRGAAFWRS